MKPEAAKVIAPEVVVEIEEEEVVLLVVVVLVEFVEGRELKGFEHVTKMNPSSICVHEFSVALNFGLQASVQVISASHS